MNRPNTYAAHFAYGLFAMSLVSQPLFAKPSKPAKATGQAAIIEGDKAEALKQAKRDAMRQVIERAGGVSVVSQTIVRNYQLVSDEIVTNARGAIVNPKWGEPAYKDGVASISLSAQVENERLQDAICAVVKANLDPKVAIVMVEKVGGPETAFTAGKGIRGPIEQKVTEHFLENCFSLVESGIKVTTTSDGDFTKEQMDKIRDGVNADYVVMGKGWVIDNGSVFKSSKLKSFSIGVDLKLINLQTGAIEVAASDSTGTGIGVLNAGAAMQLSAPMYKRHKDPTRIGTPKARTKGGCPNSADGVVDCAVGGLYGKIAAAWQSELVNAHKVVVEVRGVKSYSLGKKFRLGVEKKIKGSSVVQRKLKKGIALLDIELEGGADRLASEIDGMKIAKKKVEVVEVTRGKIVLVLK